MNHELHRFDGSKSFNLIMAVDKVAYESVPSTEKNGGLLDPSPPQKPKGFGTRHMQTLILFVSLTTAFTMKSQLSVIMVAMVEHIPHTNVTCNSTIAMCGHNVTVLPLDTNSNISRWSVFRKYDWSKSTQELVTFSFFVGYTSMMLPMGIIAQKFGGKLPMMVGLAVNGVLSILTPWLPLVGGWIAVSVSRLLQGMTQAAFYPGIHTMLGKWAPLSERGRLSTYIYTGSQLGTILAFQISGLFSGIPVLGWPSSFWFFGSCSLVCCVLMGIYGAASPHEHPTISSEELSYIMGDVNADVVPKKRRTPWKHIIRSKAVWGLFATHAGSASGYLLVLTEIPTYMSNVLGVDIKSNGILSSLPYLAMYFMALFFGYLSDFLGNRKILSIVNIRRVFNSIGMVLSGAFLIGFSFVSNTALAVILLILCLGLHSGVHVGFHINQIDLAPNFAGTLMGMGNMIATLTGLLVPVIVASIVKEEVDNGSKWQIVFLIFGALQFLTNTIFIIFVKGTVQPWNFYGEEGNELEEELAVMKEKPESKESKPTDEES